MNENSFYIIVSTLTDNMHFLSFYDIAVNEANVALLALNCLLMQSSIHPQHISF